MSGPDKLGPARGFIIGAAICAVFWIIVGGLL